MSEPRDYLAEAHAILRGETMLLPQVEHLKAMAQEKHSLVTLAVGVIRTWHDIQGRHMPPEMIEDTWKIYCRLAESVSEVRIGRRVQGDHRQCRL